MDSVRRLFVAGAGVLVIVSMSYVAVNYGVAGIASANATRELERLSRSPSSSSGDWWIDDLRRTVRDVGKDPTAHELLGLGLMGNAADSQQLEAARHHFVRAIAQRPGSGYTWANFAVVKYRLGETDAMFETALVHAISLAPYEPEVQRDVVNYGLAVMDEAKPQTREAIERALAAGMKRNAPEILQISSRRGKLGAACRHLDGVPRPAESKWTQLCQSLEATS